MIDTQAVAQAFALLFGSWQPWLVVVPGMFIGLIFGALPGLGASMALALVLPFTLYMDFLTAIIFMTAIFTGNGFGCAVPAILLNLPGSPGAVATTFDGFPMAKQGLHNEALGLGLAASSVAEALSYIILFFLVETIAWSVLKLGPPEMFVVALWGLSLIAALRSKSISRGLFAGVLGLLIGTIGFSARGNIRGTMGFELLIDGIPAVPALMGLFVASKRSAPPTIHLHMERGIRGALLRRKPPIRAPKEGRWRRCLRSDCRAARRPPSCWRRSPCTT